MKVLFAHNALTSYKPKGLVSKCGNWLAKCQKHSVPELLEKGVRGFDIRFRVDKKGNKIASHGACDYKVNVDEIFTLLSSYPEKIYVRIINEDTFKNSNEMIFRQEVLKIMAKHANISYKVYSSKKNWPEPYFWTWPNEKETELIWTKDKGANTPERYAKKHNPEFKKLVEEAEGGFFYMDFID